MKLLYGTGNPAKAAAMQNRIAGLGIELISLQDLQAQGEEIPDVPETGNTPLENARQKAHAYYEAFRMPVFSCDSGLYFEDVPEAIHKILETVNVLALFVHFICISLEFQKEIEYFDHINIKKLLKLLKMC